jgi:hypothetical protein
MDAAVMCGWPDGDRKSGPGIAAVGLDYNGNVWQAGGRQPVVTLVAHRRTSTTQARRPAPARVVPSRAFVNPWCGQATNHAAGVGQAAGSRAGPVGWAFSGHRFLSGCPYFASWYFAYRSGVCAAGADCYAAGQKLTTACPCRWPRMGSCGCLR